MARNVVDELPTPWGDFSSRSEARHAREQWRPLTTTKWQMNEMIPQRGTDSGPRMRVVNGPRPVHKRLGSWALVEGIGGGVTSERRERLYVRVLRVEVSASAASTSKSEALSSKAVLEALDETGSEFLKQIRYVTQKFR
ncbi:hypothetical protein NL676_022341 [Syzygium grande]|nr:hypothetical protein NL676_022341 [Syzygium grande]